MSPANAVSAALDRPEVRRVMRSIFDTNVEFRGNRLIWGSGPTKEQRDASMALKIANIRHFHPSRLHAIQSITPRLPQ